MYYFLLYETLFFNGKFVYIQNNCVKFYALFFLNCCTRFPFHVKFRYNLLSHHSSYTRLRIYLFFLFTLLSYGWCCYSLRIKKKRKENQPQSGLFPVDKWCERFLITQRFPFNIRRVFVLYAYIK